MWKKKTIIERFLGKGVDELASVVVMAPLSLHRHPLQYAWIPEAWLVYSGTCLCY